MPRLRVCPNSCISPALKAARSKWQGPLAAYANSGTFFVVPEPGFGKVVPPDTYLHHVQEWLELGARVVGGCCGVGREHIRLISETFGSASLK